MQVSVEKQDGLKHLLSIEIPAERVNHGLDEEFKKLSQRIALPGFRPGRVPMTHLKKNYGPNVARDLARRFVDETIENAIVESKLNCAGVDKVEMNELVNGQPFIQPLLWAYYLGFHKLKWGRIHQ